jgi:hypothetical protein
VALALLSGWSAAPAAAHNYLVSSSPEDGAVVTEQPGAFSVTTNDALLDLDGTGAPAQFRSAARAVLLFITAMDASRSPVAPSRPPRSWAKRGSTP